MSATTSAGTGEGLYCLPHRIAHNPNPLWETSNIVQIVSKEAVRDARTEAHYRLHADDS